MLVAGGAAAYADGLPRGSCCADLEERVAELEATTARKGNRKVSLTISGQVTTAVMVWDGGSGAVPPTDGSDVYVVDWTPAGGTYVSFTGSARISPSLTAGFQVVIGVTSGSRSHQVNQFNDDQGGVPANGDTEIAMTLSNWYIDHTSLGRLTLGRINTSTAGLSTIDLGGAGVSANASIGYWNRGFAVVATAGAPVGPINSWSDFLGGSAVNGASLSRANAIMYTSPTFGGFSVSASWGEDEQWDAALRYAGEFAGFRIAAGLGYRYNHSGLGEALKDNPGVADVRPEQFIASGSILHLSSGLFLTASYVNQDNDNGLGDTTLWYVQAGISKNWTGLGKTVLYGEYARVDDGLSSFQCCAPANPAGTVPLPVGVPSTAEVWGLGVVQHVDAAAMELFLSYRRYTAQFDPPGFAEVNDFDVVVGGARIRF
jgi:hypothetical protein